MVNPIVLLAFACAFLNADSVANPLDDELGQAGDPPSPDRPTSVFLKTAAVIEQPNGGAVTVTQSGPGSPVKGNSDSKTEGGGDISTVYDTQQPSSTAVVSQKQDGSLSTVDSSKEPKSTSSTSTPPSSTSSVKTTSKPASTSSTHPHNRPVREANNDEPEPDSKNNNNKDNASSSVELTGALGPTGTIQPAATIAASGDPQMAAVENGEGELEDMMEKPDDSDTRKLPQVDMPKLPNLNNFGVNKGGFKKKSTTSVVYTLVSKYGEKMSIPQFLNGVPIIGPDGKPTGTAHVANAAVADLPTPAPRLGEGDEALTSTVATDEGTSSTATSAEKSSSTSAVSSTTSGDTSAPSDSGGSPGDNKFSLQGIPAGGRVPDANEEQPPAHVPSSLNVKAGDGDSSSSDNEDDDEKVDTPVANGGRVGNHVPARVGDTGVAVIKTSSDLTTTIIISVTDTIHVTQPGPTITTTAVAYQGGIGQGLAKRRIPALADNEVVDFGVAEGTVTNTEDDVSLTVQETEIPSTVAVVTSQPTKITDEPALQTDVQSPVNNISDTPTVPATQTQLPTGPDSITVSSFIMPTGSGVNMTALSGLTSGANLTTDSATETGNLSTQLQTSVSNTPSSVPAVSTSSISATQPSSAQKINSEAEKALINMLPPLVTSQPPLATSQPALVTTQPAAAKVPAGMESGSAVNSEAGESAVALESSEDKNVVPYLTLYSTLNNHIATTSALPTTFSTKVKVN